MLTAHLISTINHDPRLLRVLGIDVTDTTNWHALVEAADDGVLSSGERALAVCLCALGGATTRESFGYWFDGLDGGGMRAIVTLLDAYATDTQTAGQSSRRLTEG